MNIYSSTHQYLLGLDVGSSSVKASLVDIESGNCVAPIKAIKTGWAEQAPQMWWIMPVSP